MSTSLVDAQSVLAIDVGSINTRAILLDVVDGQYHFIAVGSVPSTIYAPFYDAMEGIYSALLRLQDITGRELVNRGQYLTVPSTSEGAGVDRVVMTVSAGPELRMVTTGLLNDVSLESAQRLAATVCVQVMESLGLNDRRRPEVQLDAILRVRPDLIVIAGGTDKGATRSIAKSINLAGLVCQLLPKESRPEVLYAGNQALSTPAKETLEKMTQVHLAPNIRPTIDNENLRPAQEMLAKVVARMRTRQLGKIDSVLHVLSCEPMLTSQGFSRVIGFLSRFYTARSVLGIDIGATTTTIAAGTNGKLIQHVLRPFGMGTGAMQVLQGKVADIVQWLPLHVSDEAVRDYVWQKSISPAALPLTGESLAIEQAIARQLIRSAVQQASARWPEFPTSFEPIVASGAVFAQAASPGQALLMLLDGLQPVGVTSFFLDQFGVTPGLGAIAEISSLLPVQVIETGAYLNLGTAICPVTNAKYGTPILKVSLDYGGGHVSKAEIKQGTLTVLPLAPGQVAQVEFEPLVRKIEIDPTRKDNPRRFKITGGACGAVIDARGRPLVLPPDAPRRREMIKKWSLALS